jgi:hypothetical protein
MSDNKHHYFEYSEHSSRIFRSAVINTAVIILFMHAYDVNDTEISKCANILLDC